LSQKLLAAANEKPSQTRGGTQWAESCEWNRLSEVVQDLATQIAGSWLTEERPTTLTTIDINADVKDAEHSGSDMQRWRMRAEEFLAMYVLLIVRDLLSRLANGFFYIMIAVILMVAVQQSFPFEPRQELLAMVWIYVVSAIILVLTIVVQM